MTTTYCTHPYSPVWRVDPDGIGSLRCSTCGTALTPQDTAPVREWEILGLFVVFLIAVGVLLGCFWKVWLA